RQALNESHVRRILGAGTGVSAAAFTPDDKRIVVTDAKGDVRIWSASKRSHPFVIHGDPQWTPAVSPDGNVVALEHFGQDEIWDLRTNREITHFPQGQGAGLSPMFSADGRDLATTNDDVITL